MAESCKHKMNKRDKQLCITKVPIFNHLARNEMMEILKRSRQMTFEKSDLIYHAGDPLEYLYIVHIGRVKIYQLFESGKEQLLRILETGEFMGELALFSEKVLDSYAEAIERTEICAIHKDDFQEIMQNHPTIPMKILSEFSNRLEETEYLVGQLSAKDVETRTASYLVKLFEAQESDQIQLPMSKGDLASYLGTTQETISRRLSSFQTKGWIAQKGHRHIKIIDIDSLKQVAKGLSD